MAIRLSTGAQLSIAAPAFLALAAAWLAMSGYNAIWPTRVVGALAICFGLYSLYLWWKWRHEKGAKQSDQVAPARAQTTGIRMGDRSNAAFNTIVDADVSIDTGDDSSADHNLIIQTRKRKDAPPDGEKL